MNVWTKQKRPETIGMVRCTLYTSKLFWVQSICHWMVKFRIERFDSFRFECNSIGMCPRLQYCLCCVSVSVCMPMCHKELRAKQIFRFDFRYIIGICYKPSLWLPGEKRTSLKTLTKANLTSSIEIRCHTEWIAWKTLTVNWKLFRSVFSSLFISLIPLAPESRCFLQFKLGVCL